MISQILNGKIKGKPGLKNSSKELRKNGTEKEKNAGDGARTRNFRRDRAVL